MRRLDANSTQSPFTNARKHGIGLSASRTATHATGPRIDTPSTDINQTICENKIPVYRLMTKSERHRNGQGPSFEAYKVGIMQSGCLQWVV